MKPPATQPHSNPAFAYGCKKHAFLYAVKLVISILCTLTLLHPARSSAQEILIVTELKEVSEDYGYLIDATVVNNRYTGMQDLHIVPAEGHSYETDNFLRMVSAAVATVTAQSPTYQTYIDMVLMDINGELWAISTESCRKAFSMATEVGQNAMLRSRLQKLR
jgi:hypothetical protein